MTPLPEASESLTPSLRVSKQHELDLNDAAGWQCQDMSPTYGIVEKLETQSNADAASACVVALERRRAAYQIGLQRLMDEEASSPYQGD